MLIWTRRSARTRARRNDHGDPHPTVGGADSPDAPRGGYLSTTLSKRMRSEQSSGAFSRGFPALRHLNGNFPLLSDKTAVELPSLVTCLFKGFAALYEGLQTIAPSFDDDLGGAMN